MSEQERFLQRLKNSMVKQGEIYNKHLQKFNLPSKTLNAAKLNYTSIDDGLRNYTDKLDRLNARASGNNTHIGNSAPPLVNNHSELSINKTYEYY
jgi:hypothetical protein